MEAPGDTGISKACQTIRHYPPEQGQGVQHQGFSVLAHRGRIHSLFVRIGGHLQFHGGLAFIGPLPADARGRGHRVEQAPGAGGQGGIPALGQLLVQHPPLQVRKMKA